MAQRPRSAQDAYASSTPGEICHALETYLGIECRGACGGNLGYAAALKGLNGQPDAVLAVNLQQCGVRAASTLPK
ncbi:hypothetical protein J2R99_000277 [Rhodopseudomonas julia]|uniref:Uncharacterized protein n=1 Tax=Rhodopseudomonas julia TaxID=200617 RepID=A0ABU0C2L0_9BRAD|nr:hypothetical protein [Rhodopseudomonas julia]MDQ0324428.1 hypothetical protein [Rhodopseudomonas julia]